MKYYVRTGYDGKPLDRFIHTFKNNPGDPYKEITIPNCCTPADTKTFISELSFQGPGCTGGWILYLDGGLVVPDPLVVIDITNISTFIQTMNEAYAGTFVFEDLGGSNTSINILIPFTSFSVYASWICE